MTQVEIEQWKPVVSILIPTRHEATNVDELIRRIENAMNDTPVELIFIDDSDDHTPEVINRHVHAHHTDNLRVRLLHRPPNMRESGLSGAVVLGMLHSRSRLWCVIDGDLQHPPEVIPLLLAKHRETGANLVVASRYCQTGAAGGLAPWRYAISICFTKMAHRMHGAHIETTDPMSGFFLLDGSQVDTNKLKPRGFKILLEVMVRCGPLKTTEVGFEFAQRHSGDSKGRLQEGINFLLHLRELRE